MKKTHKTSNMTSFFGHTITATPAQLKKMFGAPTYDDNNGFDKTNLEWVMENSTGAVVTIYDWKTYSPLGNNEEVHWHLGGHSGQATSQAQKEIESLLRSLN